MKVYVVLKDEDSGVIAISESEKDVINFVLARNYSEKEFYYTKVKGRTAERLLIDFEDLYLEHDDELDVVFTRIERRIVRQTLDEEKDRIVHMLSDLDHVLANYKLSKKEKQALVKAHKTIYSMKKTKHLKKAIELDNFVGFITKSKHLVDMLRDKIYQLASEMYIFINTDEEE